MDSFVAEVAHTSPNHSYTIKRFTLDGHHYEVIISGNTTAFISRYPHNNAAISPRGMGAQKQPTFQIEHI